MLVLIAKCSGSDEIPLDRAEQSSTLEAYTAAKAIDGDLKTWSKTTPEDPAWLRLYLSSSSTVERMVVEKGYSYDYSCVWTREVVICAVV